MKTYILAYRESNPQLLGLCVEPQCSTPISQNVCFHDNIPHTTIVLKQPKGTPVDICEAHFESDDTSFTLPVCVNGTTCDAIIDTGTGVSIVSYECWCKWGSQKMLPSDVKLQMADGSIQRPEGM